jgi:protein-tyrosine-phosphatase
MPHILVVCTANICRSPVGEVILRDRLQRRGLPEWSVASAGTWGLDGRGASQHSITVMAEEGFELQGHQARTINQEMLAQADLVLCMESGHVEAIKAEFPRYKEKVFLLSEMIGQRYSLTDPYGGPIEEYKRMAKEITNMIDEGLERIIALAQADQANET